MSDHNNTLPPLPDDALTHLGGEPHAPLEAAEVDRLTDAIFSAWEEEPEALAPLPEGAAEEAALWAALDDELSALERPANDDIEVRRPVWPIWAAAIAACAAALLAVVMLGNGRDESSQETPAPSVQSVPVAPAPEEPVEAKVREEPAPAPDPDPIPESLVASLLTGTSRGAAARSPEEEPRKRRVVSIRPREEAPKEASVKEEPVADLTAGETLEAEETARVAVEEPPSAEALQERAFQSHAESCRDRVGARGAGRVVFDVHVDAAGRVERVGHISRDYEDALALCIEEKIRTWTFAERGTNFQMVFRFKAR